MGLLLEAFQKILKAPYIRPLQFIVKMKSKLSLSIAIILGENRMAN